MEDKLIFIEKIKKFFETIRAIPRAIQTHTLYFLRLSKCLLKLYYLIGLIRQKWNNISSCYRNCYHRIQSNVILHLDVVHS